MIELAPTHKYGLPINNPVMVAGGTIGYGEAVGVGMSLDTLGAVVIGPFTRNSRAGSEPPRLAQNNGGFVLGSGLQNRGVKAAKRHFARLWPTLGCPVIAQVADSVPAMAGQVAEQLATSPGVHGLELLVPDRATPDLVRDLMRQLLAHTDLPVMAKVPFFDTEALATAAVEAGACALVIAQPATGTGYTKANGGNQIPVSGLTYGPLTFALMCETFEAVRRLALPCPLVACGGIHTLAQCTQILAAGASALQMESAAWVEPALPSRLARALQLTPR